MTKFYVTTTDPSVSVLISTTFDTSTGARTSSSSHTPADSGSDNISQTTTGQAVFAFPTNVGTGPYLHTSATWPTTGWGCSLDITSASADWTYDIGIDRITNNLTSDTGTIASPSNLGLSALSGTGIKSATGVTSTTVNNAMVFSGTAVAEDNNVDVYIDTNAPGGMPTNRTLTVLVSDSQTWVEGTSLTPPSSTPTITCQTITAASTLFNPTIINTQEIFLNVLNVPGSILSPTVRFEQFINADVLAASSTLFSPSLDYNIELQVLNTSSTIFTPEINQDIAAPVIAATSAIFDPSLIYDVVVPLITTTSSLFDPSSILNIDTTTIAAPATVNNPTVTTLTTFVMQVLNAPETVYTPATDTSINIEGQLITAASTLFNPTVDQDISLNVLNASATINNFTVSSAGAGQNVNLEVIGATPVVNSPSVTTLTTVVADVLNAPSVIQAPALSYNVEVPVLNTSSTLFTPSLEYLIELQTINTAPSIHAPRIGEEVDDGFSGAIVKPYDPQLFPSGIR